MYSLLFESFISLFCSSGILYLILATVFGFLVGILPGIGQGTALILALPLALLLPKESALIFYSSLLGATTFGGTVTSIILGIPGSAQNITTVIDGYPMARSGQAGRALGLAAGSSFAGAIIGLVVIMLTIPFVKLILYYYGSSEFFLTIVLAIIVVSVVSGKGKFFKGLSSMVFGFLISLAGMDHVFGVTRYTGGIFYLWNGIKLSVFLIGLFALSEMVILQSEGRTIAKKGVANVKISEAIKGFWEALKNWVVLCRGALIGVLIGILPGVGGDVAQFISYGFEKGISKDKDSFGSGNPKGVIVSEVSNNAKDGGALIPTLFLGIPGSPEMAVLLGIFLVMGIIPGPDMAIAHLDLVILIITATLVSNVVVAIFTVLASGFLSRITIFPIYFIFAFVVPLSFASVYAWSTNYWDLAIAGVFCIIGIFLKRAGFPVAPVILGYVLGPLAETSFHRTLASGYYNPLIFFQSSFSIVLIIITVMVLLLFAVFQFTEQKKLYQAKSELTSKNRTTVWKVRDSDSLLVTIIFLMLGIIFVFISRHYDLARAGLWPFVVSIVLIFSSIIILISESRINLNSPVIENKLVTTKLKWKNLFPTLLFLFMYIILMILLGIHFTNFISFVLFFKLFSKTNLLKSVLFGLIISICIYLLFAIAFDVLLWPGLIPTVIPNIIGGGSTRAFF